MKRIAIISDTHGFWDEKYVTYMADCDEIWHACTHAFGQSVETLMTWTCVHAIQNSCVLNAREWMY